MVRPAPNGPEDVQESSSEQPDAGLDADTAVDSLLDGISHPWRRSLLLVLLTRSDQLFVDECVTHLEQQQSMLDDPTPSYDQLARALHHVHLPKLDDLGLVEYDPESRTVVCTAPEQTRQLLDRFMTYRGSLR